MKPSRWMRVYRGAIAASFATFVAGFSHVAGGGALPGAGAIAFCLALSLLVCLALVGRTHSLWRTTIAVGLSQFVFHALFSSMSGSGVTISSASPSHAVHGAPNLEVATSMSASGGHSLMMWVAHIFAAALTTLALLYTDAACRTLRSTSTLFFSRLLARTVPPVTAQPRTAPRVGSVRAIRVHKLATLFSALRHRGPPPVVAA